MSKTLLLINTLGLGGAERVLVGIANQYAKTYGEIEVLSLVEKVDYTPKEGVVLKFLSNRVNFNSTLFPYFLFRFYLFCLKDRPNLVQSHLFWSNYINVIVARLLHHKTQLVHCVSFRSKYSSGFVSYLHYLMCSFLLKRANLNIFKSYEMRDEYAKLFSIPYEKTKVIYNPVRKPIKSQQKIWKKKSNFIEVSVVGRFHSSKRHDDLLEIAKSLSGQIIFHCIGTGELLENFKSKVAKKNLQNNFIFHGWQKDPLSIMKTSDIYLSCSEAEGFPNALIEAMSIGLPAIHTDCKTGPKEILGPVKLKNKLYEKREFGITYAVGDIVAVTRILEDFISNKIDGKFYSNQSITRVLQLSARDSTEAYLDLLNFES